MAILLPGGAGFIGSHTAVELLNKGREIVIIDNFSNSTPKALEAIKKITGKDFKFYEMDYMDREKLEKVFEENNIEAVMNFAGYKAVGESVQKPIEYYTNNISGALVLLDTMRKYGCKKFIFSSSATVYGEPEKMPITEDTPTGGTTKLFIEQILKDIYKSDNTWDICILRYFNPVGAHESGLIGEEPKGIPNNLMPYVARVAAGTLKELSVFGNDYNTPDGTGVRDYIHVVDLAKGHIKALEKLEKSGIKKLLVISQTTYSLEKFYIIKEIIENELPKNIELVIKNTICATTEQRQIETKELSKKVDIMIIIGGKNSSNTKKLYEVAIENCKKALCIETYKELENLQNDIKNANTIGIMAGASTPQKSIEEVVEYLNKK